MNNLSAFMAGNAVKNDLVKYAASDRFKDENGKVVEFELVSVTSEVDEDIRKACTKKVQVPGKKGMYVPETDYDKYLGMLASKCIVFPDLNNAELQDSYKVLGAESLLKTMLKPGEYQDLLKKIQEVNGFDVSMEELVEEAKN